MPKNTSTNLILIWKIDLEEIHFRSTLHKALR